jgi:hypothetical protein
MVWSYVSYFVADKGIHGGIGAGIEHPPPGRAGVEGEAMSPLPTWVQYRS